MTSDYYYLRCGVCLQEIKTEWGPETYLVAKRTLYEHLLTHSTKEMKEYAFRHLMGGYDHKYPQEVAETQHELRKGLAALALEVPRPVWRDINKRAAAFWNAAWDEINRRKLRT